MRIVFTEEMVHYRQDSGTERGIDFFLVDDRVLIQEFAADENWPRKWQFQKSENSVHPCLTEKFYVVVLMPSGRRRSLQLVRNHFLCVDEYTSDGTWDGLYGQLTRMYGRARQAGSVVPVETPVVVSPKLFEADWAQESQIR